MIDKNSHEAIVKIVNASGNEVAIEVMIAGIKPTAKEANLQILSSADKEKVNSFQLPQGIIPVTEKIGIKKNAVAIALEPMSLTIIRIPAGK